MYNKVIRWRFMYSLGQLLATAFLRLCEHPFAHPTHILTKHTHTHCGHFVYKHEACQQTKNRQPKPKPKLKPKPNQTPAQLELNPNLKLDLSLPACNPKPTSDSFAVSLGAQCGRGQCLQGNPSRVDSRTRLLFHFPLSPGRVES